MLCQQFCNEDATVAARWSSVLSISVFMERILLALNSIKVTQQTHSEYFSLLLRNTEDAPLDPEGLPDLPFSTEQDFVHFDKELEVDKRARLRMVNDGYSKLSSVFCIYA